MVAVEETGVRSGEGLGKSQCQLGRLVSTPIRCHHALAVQFNVVILRDLDRGVADDLGRGRVAHRRDGLAFCKVLWGGAGE